MNLRGKFIPKFSSLHCFTACIAIIFIFFITNKGYCQSGKFNVSDTTTAAKDTIKLSPGTISIDSLKTDSLSAKTDTSKRIQMEKALGIKISKDALPSVVTANAEDSAILDVQHNLFYLYGGKEGKADVT